MASPSTQREAGIPTVICVNDLMAIGTSRGFILVYDVQQNLKMMLGSSNSGALYGAVTSIEVNFDNTRILVGHENGQVGKLPYCGHLQQRQSVPGQAAIEVGQQRWSVSEGCWHIVCMDTRTNRVYHLTRGPFQPWIVPTGPSLGPQ